VRHPSVRYLLPHIDLVFRWLPMGERDQAKCRRQTDGRADDEPDGGPDQRIAGPERQRERGQDGDHSHVSSTWSTRLRATITAASSWTMASSTADHIRPATAQPATT